MKKRSSLINLPSGYKIFAEPNDALGMLKLFANQYKVNNLIKNVTFLKGNAAPIGVRRNSTGMKRYNCSNGFWLSQCVNICNLSDLI